MKPNQACSNKTKAVHKSKMDLRNLNERTTGSISLKNNLNDHFALGALTSEQLKPIMDDLWEEGPSSKKKGRKKTY